MPDKENFLFRYFPFSPPVFPIGQSDPLCTQVWPSNVGRQEGDSSLPIGQIVAPPLSFAANQIPSAQVWPSNAGAGGDSSLPIGQIVPSPVVPRGQSDPFTGLAPALLGQEEENPRFLLVR